MRGLLLGKSKYYLQPGICIFKGNGNKVIQGFTILLKLAFTLHCFIKTVSWLYSPCLYRNGWRHGPQHCIHRSWGNITSYGTDKHHRCIGGFGTVKLSIANDTV